MTVNHSDHAGTDQVWPSWRTSCPPVDDALLDGYVTCLKRAGLLLGRD
ncbi:hypothetical protein [Streptomyces lydicus]